MKLNKLFAVLFIFFLNNFYISRLFAPIKDDPAAAKKTQIEAQLSIPWIKNKVEKLYEIENFKSLVNAMNRNARAKMEAYYDFYHAQAPGFRIFQDFYKKCYEFFMITARLKHFTFLRMRDPIFDRYSDISDFLKDELRQRGLIDDNLGETKCYVLSVNLSPFGNVGTPGEATFDYFLQGFSHADPEPFLIHIFDKFALDKRFIPELKKLDDLVYTKEGSLFQIFIPKKDVDKVAYLSWRHGVPFDEKIIESLFGGIFATNDIVSEQLKKIGEIYLKPKSDLFAIEIELNKLLKRINDGTFRISKILDKYRSAPEKLKYLNNLQARLLLSNDMLLNPQSGVIILRYTTVPKNTMDEYLRKLEEVSNQIFTDWLERNLTNEDIVMPTEKTRVEVLLKLMKEGKIKTGETIDPNVLAAHIGVLQELKSKVPEVPPIEEKKYEQRKTELKHEAKRIILNAKEHADLTDNLNQAERLFTNNPKAAKMYYEKTIKSLISKGIDAAALKDLKSENINKIREMIKK